jgi:hypothetical protein
MTGCRQRQLLKRFRNLMRPSTGVYMSCIYVSEVRINARSFFCNSTVFGYDPYSAGAQRWHYGTYRRCLGALVRLGVSRRDIGPSAHEFSAQHVLGFPLKTSERGGEVAIRPLSQA